MKSYKYKFTVVVPIYKVEKYLAETLDSVICQTIGFEENIEIILVNDGSPDNCDEICRGYCSKYPNNIRYLVKENGGLSSARNFGIPCIQGKYVNFLDADDKWEENAFEKAYNFFEKNFDDIDFLASRVRFFDEKNNWHVLDYKYNNGTRVVDLTDPKEYNSVQVHVTSAFIKVDAIDSMRFNERVRFGEDGLFSNALILSRMKYGLVADCVYYYRKRSDKTSLTQIQSANREYYGDSPRLYYDGLVQESSNRFGCVIPYIQNVLAYDIGWRVRASVPDEIRNDRAFFASYLNYLNNILGCVEDEVYLRSRVHKRISVKCAFYKLKHPDKELADITRFDLKKKSVYVGDVRLYNFNKTNHSACIINDCVFSERELYIEGLISRWLLSSCSESELAFVIKVNGNVYYPEITDCTSKTDITVFGKTYPYFTFKKEISVESLNAPDTLPEINLALDVKGNICEITAKRT